MSNAEREHDAPFHHCTFAFCSQWLCKNGCYDDLLCCHLLLPQSLSLSPSSNSLSLSLPFPVLLSVGIRKHQPRGGRTVWKSKKAKDKVDHQSLGLRWFTGFCVSWDPVKASMCLPAAGWWSQTVRQRDPCDPWSARPQTDHADISLKQSMSSSSFTQVGYPWPVSGLLCWPEFGIVILWERTKI